MKGLMLIYDSKLLSSLFLCLHANLVLFQSSVYGVGCDVMCLLENNLLSQGSFGFVQPRSNHIQRSRQGPVQLKMPVQKLRHRHQLRKDEKQFWWFLKTFNCTA